MSSFATAAPGNVRGSSARWTGATVAAGPAGSPGEVNAGEGAEGSTPSGVERWTAVSGIVESGSAATGRTGNPPGACCAAGVTAAPGAALRAGAAASNTLAIEGEAVTWNAGAMRGPARSALRCTSTKSGIVAARDSAATVRAGAAARTTGAGAVPGVETTEEGVADGAAMLRAIKGAVEGAIGCAGAGPLPIGAVPTPRWTEAGVLAARGRSTPLSPSIDDGVTASGRGTSRPAALRDELSARESSVRGEGTASGSPE